MALTKLQAAVIEGVLGLTWQSPAKTSSFAAAIGNGYYLNTTTGAITVTLPSSPTIGDSIGIIDYAGTAASNSIILTSSNNIQGSSDDKIVNYTRGALRITYADTTQGWVASAAANEGTSALNPSPFLVDYLVVAGGGGGGASNLYSQGSGGGGAGGFITSTLAVNVSVSYPVTVGDGGAVASPGLDSIFSNITSTGGGNGGNDAGGGSSGGSGGGSGAQSGLAGYAGNAGGFTPVEGNNGGGGSASAYVGGGGGGGGAVGKPGSSNWDGGAGGAGIINNILNTTNATTASVGQVSGTDVYYTGGGGGGNLGGGGAGAAGGIGGGGRGSSANASYPNIAGSPNTGGGGGGGIDGPKPGVPGGSGVVILKYPNTFLLTKTGIIEASGSPFTDGTNLVSVFTGGTGTITFS